MFRSIARVLGALTLVLSVPAAADPTAKTTPKSAETTSHSLWWVCHKFVPVSMQPPRINLYVSSALEAPMSFGDAYVSEVSTRALEFDALVLSSGHQAVSSVPGEAAKPAQCDIQLSKPEADVERARLLTTGGVLAGIPIPWKAAP